jgi:hypothetical protein
MKPPTTSEVLEITNNEISLFLLATFLNRLYTHKTLKSLVMKDLGEISGKMFHIGFPTFSNSC